VILLGVLIIGAGFVLWDMVHIGQRRCLRSPIDES
jgi:hypothetical protein